MPARWLIINWLLGRGEEMSQRSVCKCGHHKKEHSVHVNKTCSNVYGHCNSKCDCRKFRAKAKGEL
jgi:hypothetical protein